MGLNKNQLTTQFWKKSPTVGGYKGLNLFPNTGLEFSADFPS